MKKMMDYADSLSKEQKVEHDTQIDVIGKYIEYKYTQGAESGTWHTYLITISSYYTTAMTLSVKLFVRPYIS